MKLAQIAINGLMGLAGLTAASTGKDRPWWLNHLKARGELDAAWVDDATHKYM
jgi:hypothetical protein